LAEKNFKNKSPWTKKVYHRIIMADVQGRMIDGHFHMPNIPLKEDPAKTGGLV